MLNYLSRYSCKYGIFLIAGFDYNSICSNNNAVSQIYISNNLCTNTQFDSISQHRRNRSMPCISNTVFTMKIAILTYLCISIN